MVLETYVSLHILPVYEKVHELNFDGICTSFCKYVGYRETFSLCKLVHKPHFDMYRKICVEDGHLP